MDNSPGNTVQSWEEVDNVRDSLHPVNLWPSFGSGTKLVVVLSTEVSISVTVTVLFRFGTGFAQPGLYGIPVLYGLEILGKPHRRLCAIALNVFYASGMLLIPLAAWLIRDQRIFHAALSIPTFVFMLYWW